MSLEATRLLNPKKLNRLFPLIRCNRRLTDTNRCLLQCQLVVCNETVTTIAFIAAPVRRCNEAVVRSRGVLIRTRLQRGNSRFRLYLFVELSTLVLCGKSIRRTVPVRRSIIRDFSMNYLFDCTVLKDPLAMLGILDTGVPTTVNRFAEEHHPHFA